MDEHSFVLINMLEVGPEMLEVAPENHIQEQNLTPVCSMSMSGEGPNELQCEQEHSAAST